ncbi:MAG: hypothetical protein QOI95_819 [Acidimicrobiaceae bacterium]|jgi:hypothetical protein
MLRRVAVVALLALLIFAPAVYIGTVSAVGERIGQWYADGFRKSITTTTSTTTPASG